MYIYIYILLLHQGEEGFHAGAVTLQRRDEASGAEWQEYVYIYIYIYIIYIYIYKDVATWEEVADGKAKLAPNNNTSNTNINGTNNTNINNYC